jgi:hypothetical protein
MQILNSRFAICDSLPLSTIAYRFALDTAGARFFLPLNSRVCAWPRALRLRAGAETSASARFQGANGPLAAQPMQPGACPRRISRTAPSLARRSFLQVWTGKTEKRFAAAKDFSFRRIGSRPRALPRSFFDAPDTGLVILFTFLGPFAVNFSRSPLSDPGVVRRGLTIVATMEIVPIVCGRGHGEASDVANA